MNPEDKIKELIGKSDIATDAQTENRILGDALNHLDILKQKTPRIGLYIWRIIMKSHVIKLAAAAVIIMAITLGLFEFIGTESTSGVVWADVVRKVEASQGIIFRSKDIEQDWRDIEPDYTMNYFSSTQARHDSYKGDHIFKTIYADFNTKTVILVDHLPSHKAYVKMTFEEMEQVDFVTNPKSLIQRFLSCEYRKLGTKTVEGVFCEGIETTDPAFFIFDDHPVDGLRARIWVSVKTGYPVQLDMEIVRNNGEIRLGGVWDQFQWDVELDKSIFKPEIPADYIDISP